MQPTYLGDPPMKAYSIIKHLRKICPGAWTYKHPQKWVHKTGITVFIPHLRPDVLAGPYVGRHRAIVAFRNDDGWEWTVEGVKLLRRLTGGEQL